MSDIRKFIQIVERAQYSPEFLRWFGDSKAVDKWGYPLVVYHGTKHDFHAFDAAKTGTSTDSGWFGQGIYLTPHTDEASSYAQMGKDASGFYNHLPQGQVMPLYVRAENPFVTDQQSMTQEYVDEILADGYDAIFRVDYPGDEIPQEIVVFDPNQIKSAISNTGKYSNDHRITESEAAPDNIILTLPATVDWNDYKKELAAVADGSEVMRFKVNKLPLKPIKGGRCYLVHKGFIVGWMEIVGTHSGAFKCSTTGQDWNGNFIERSGKFHSLAKPIAHKGFQGWRYYEAPIDETYSPENGQFLNYMKDQEFDPYNHWYEVCQWLEDNDYLDLVGDLFGEEFESAEELQDEDAGIFYKLPEDVQKNCADSVIHNVMDHDPAEAPTWSHMSLNKKKVLPRNTWLIHFTNDPEGIAEKGFTIGMDDMNRLGLTTYFKDTAESKSAGGYNFAFTAFSRYAKACASNGKYGKQAVMFQNSGVEGFHYGDDEDQVVFWGKGVDPRDIIVLRNYGDEWRVQSARPTRGKSSLFGGEFEDCVRWVMNNYAQYRRYLSRR